MRRRRIAIYLIIVVSVAAGIATGRGFFLTVAYAFGGLLLIAALWALGGASGLRLDRQTRTRRAQVGRYLEEQFTIHSTNIFPKLSLEIYDSSDLPGHQASHVIGMVTRRQGVQWGVRTMCLKRGRFTLGPIEMVSIDPFGLFQVRRTDPQISHVIVYPPVIPIDSFPLPSGILPGGDALRRRTYQVTANASGVRDYAPGDSFNRIHWRTTAHKGRLMVKEFELDPLSDIWIVPDLHQPVHTGRHNPDPGDMELRSALRRNPSWVPPTTEEYTITLAASIAMHFLQKDRSVGLVTHAGYREMIQVDRGSRQITKMLETLAVARAEGPRPLDQVLALEGTQLARGAAVIVITPSVQTEWVQAAQTLSRRGLKTIAVLVDGHSFGGFPGMDEIEAQLNALRLAHIRVRRGDDFNSLFRL